MLCCLQNEKFEDILLVTLVFSAITNGAFPPSKLFSLQEVHLVRCLTYISQRYFAPGRSVVISSPANYGDMQQELIAEIHRNFIWPVVVTVDGNINKANKTDFIDRNGSYIILIPDGDFKYFHDEIFGLIVGRKNESTRFWNSEARFVVAGANEFSMTQQRQIFEYFSKLRIYNCIIVSQVHYILEKEYSRPINLNDVDTGMKLGVYTWFPYQSSDRCTEVNDIILMDSWVISAQGYFTKNIDLFPRKIRNNLNGCPLNVVVRDCHWGITTNYVHYNDSNGNVRRYIEGLEYDLLRVVLQKMNMAFVHVPTPESFKIGNSSVYHLARAMFEKDVYIALGQVGTHPFVSHFDYTNTYYMMSVRWYVPCSVKNPRWSSIFRTMSVELWLVLIISIVIAAISTTLVGRYSCILEWQGYKTLTSSLTNIWAVILGVSVSTMPRIPSVRSLFLSWVCFSLAFSTVFQAFLTTFLIDSGYKPPIRNMDELLASGIKLAYPLEYSFIFEKGDEAEASQVKRNHVNCLSYEICVNWAKYQKNVSILLLDNVAEDNYGSIYYDGSNSEPLLCRLEDGVVFNTGLSMIMFHGDPLLRQVSEIIDRVVEAGLYNFWISLSTNMHKSVTRKISLVHPLDTYISFNLYHLEPAFYLLLLGWCLSAICFMFEVLYNRVFGKKSLKFVMGDLPRYF